MAFQSLLVHELAHAKVVRETTPSLVCLFCKKAEVDELNLGPMYNMELEGEKNVVTHYFCLLFSAGLTQKGDDKEGILGFLTADIMTEVKRAQRLRCSYCHKTGASVGCCYKRCPKAFHFPCGLEKDANYHHFNNYESFCCNHARRPAIDVSNKKDECPICLSPIEGAKFPIVGSCCNSAIFHKECIQRVAFNSGYYFKCPTCNATESFSADIRSQGIFVPEQDASWERDPNAYQDLLVQYGRCDFEDCDCPDGREFKIDDGESPWLLARCRICGASGVHRKCGNLTVAGMEDWACRPCLEVEIRTEKEKGKEKEKETKTVATNLENGDLQTIEADINRESTTVAGEEPVAGPSGTTARRRRASSRQQPTKRRVTKTRKNSASNVADAADDSMESVDMEALEAAATEYEMENNLRGINFRQLLVLPSCREYFPHDRATLMQFAPSLNIPDWRRLGLTVQLVDLFQSGTESASPSTGSSQRTQNTTANDTQASRTVLSAAASGSEPNASSQRFQASRTQRARLRSTDKRTYRKRSGWKNGVYRKRLVNKPRKELEDVGSDEIETMPNSQEISLPDCAQFNSTSATNDLGISDLRSTPPSKSSAILAGIRRSELSLRNWSHGSNEQSKTEDELSRENSPFSSDERSPKRRKGDDPDEEFPLVMSTIENNNVNHEGKAAFGAHTNQLALSNAPPKSSSETPADVENVGNLELDNRDMDVSDVSDNESLEKVPVTNGHVRKSRKFSDATKNGRRRDSDIGSGLEDISSDDNWEDTHTTSSTSPQPSKKYVDGSSTNSISDTRGNNDGNLTNGYLINNH